VALLERIEMVVLENHRRTCVLQCLSLASIFNDYRCHLVRHQHRDDNVVCHDLASPIQNVVEVNVPLIILR